MAVFHEVSVSRFDVTSCCSLRYSTYGYGIAAAALFGWGACCSSNRKSGGVYGYSVKEDHHANRTL